MIRKIQQKKKLSFLGPQNTYSHKAAKARFGDSVIYDCQPNFDVVIDAVAKGRSDMAIIPFFNPYEEHIRECQEKLFTTDLIVTDVIKLRVELQLASNRLKLQEIKTVLSNEHVYKQCDIWLQKNLVEAVKESVNSTADAAGKIKEVSSAAAICSMEAAQMLGLDIIAQDIQNPKNFTLFFVMRRKEDIEEWGDYSLFCFKLNDRKEKMDILAILQNHHLRSSQKWDFPHIEDNHMLFFLEFFGSYRDLNVLAFESECTKHFTGFKFIGSFEETMTKLLEKI